MNPGPDQVSSDPRATPKRAPVLACENLERRLGTGAAAVHAVRGVSMDVYPKTSYAILGPSGCGKSTLLSALGLLDHPDGGVVRVDGVEVPVRDERKRARIRLERIGFVFQFHFLLAEFSALENVMLPMLRLGKLSRGKMTDRAAFLLERVGLGEKLERQAHRLSGGEQQRVAIARALANEPAVVLADEPTGNLDLVNAEAVGALLIELAREPGRAVVIVTHNDDLAKRCDLRLTMRDGKFV